MDVFVSYTGADEAWATWVAATLEAEGRTVRVQAWDSPAGTNVVAWINEQMTLAARTVAICSTAYFTSHWCTQEWTGALAGNTLTPLRVADCAIPKVLATIAYRDLHGVDEPTARRRLIEALGLAVPARVSPGFPGGPAPVGAVFPGGAPRQGATPATLAVPQPVRVADADPYRLGVHRAIHLPGAADETLPAYVARDIDHQPVTGIRPRLHAAATRGGFVLLVGGSSAGKTRCAFEAIRAELAGWWLLRPTSPTQITTLAAAPPARTVLWLDEIQTYLGGEHGLTATTVSALLDAPVPVVLVGTIWPERYRAFITPPPPGTRDDPYQRERDTLRQAAIVDIDSQLTPTEQTRARAAATTDPRIQAGLDNPDDGLTQTLAAAPALLHHWTSAKTDEPYAWAVITAALDATRLGVRTPLTADLLRAAAPDYCTPRQQATAPPNWFEHALAYATTPMHGATATLNPAGIGMGQLAGYTPADYLLHHTTHTRRHERGPASLWTALRDHLTHPDDLTAISGAALSRRIYTTAIPLLRRQANTSGEDSTDQLAWLLAQAGDRDELRARANAGDRYAAYGLVELLVEAGDRDELRARADTGDGHAARELAGLLVGAGERQAAIDILRARADTGDGHAARELAGLLVGAGERQAAIDILRARADTGDRYAAYGLVELLVEAGDQEALRARADAGDGYAADQLARLLVEAGDQEALRARADTGDGHAARELTRLLARLLAQAGDQEALRARADAGDGYAAAPLARLLAQAGDRNELRARADAGDGHAADQLTWLLVEAGDLDGLRARADTGDGHAALELARLLAQAGDRNELRARADAGDGHAADQLTWLLVKTKNLDGLRARADTGDWYAADRLADLLAEAGDDRLRRFGFDVHGRIADGPTW